MGVREGAIEGYLRRRVIAEGGRIRKVKWLGHDGAPDRLVWWPGPRAAFVECKAPGGVVEPRSPQRREMLRLRHDGWAVYEVNSREAVDAVVARVKGS